MPNLGKRKATGKGKNNGKKKPTFPLHNSDYDTDEPEQSYQGGQKENENDEEDVEDYDPGVFMKKKNSKLIKVRKNQKY